MARAGASLVIGSRDPSKSEEVVQAIRQAGGKAFFQATDVSKPAEVKALVARAVSEFGRLDLAHNNAGGDGQQVPLHEQDIEKASFLFDVNIKGVFYCMKYEIEQMLKTGGGAIVNTSSIFGLNGYPGWSLYVAVTYKLRPWDPWRLCCVTAFSDGALVETANQMENLRIDEPDYLRWGLATPDRALLLERHREACRSFAAEGSRSVAVLPVEEVNRLELHRAS